MNQVSRIYIVFTFNIFNINFVFTTPHVVSSSRGSEVNAVDLVAPGKAHTHMPV